MFFLFQRGQIYKIVKVDASVQPVLYKVVDLTNSPVHQQFYRQQLRIASDPSLIHFEIEKVLKTRKVRGKKQLFVKYLHYPGKIY